MISQVLLSTAPVRNAFDRAALVVHSVMLEHGFVCTGVSESSGQPLVAAQTDGSISMQILPPGWNSSADSYSFSYMHPARGSAEAFSLKSLVIGSSLAVHAASSVPGTDLLTVSFDIGAETEITQNQIVDWQDKVASSIVLRLLARQNSTNRLGKALDPNDTSQNASSSDKTGTKRPAPQEERPRPGMPDDPTRDPFFPMRDPFNPGFFPSSPANWTPYGGLLGPRHPAWGQGLPFGGGQGGMMPRFSPIGPGTGEPDPDHLRVPGLTPGNFPGFQGGASGLGRMDPDGMFMM